MDLKIFSSLGTYGQIYFYLASGSKTRDEISKYLKDCGKKPTTVNEHVNKAIDGRLPYITCKDVIIVASIITISTLIAIHDLIVHGYGAEGEYDPETKKVSAKIKPNAYYEKAV